MKQSFRNELNRWRYSIKADPRRTTLVIILLLYIATFITSFFYPLMLFVPFALFIAFAGTSAFGKKRLTPCFIMISFHGKNCINQECKYRKIKKLKRKGNTCNDILGREEKGLIQVLPVGRYAAVTHEFLIVRLWGDESIELLRCDEAYEKDIRRLQNNMYGCKKCPNHKKKNCPLRKKGSKVRPFYYIEFKKKEQSNTAR